MHMIGFNRDVETTKHFSNEIVLIDTPTISVPEFQLFYILTDTSYC